jgi:hypothetical protein
MKTAFFSLLAAGLLSGCMGVGGGGVNCNNLGASAQAHKVQAVLNAATRFEAEADALSDDLEASCTAMATDLGITVPTATGSQLQAEVTCNAVADEIETIVNDALPAGTHLVIAGEPPVCGVSVDAYADCIAMCDVNVTGEVNVMCTEGRLVGMCSGTCTGECRATGNVACSAECQGSCTGTCSGTCNGRCEGTCSVMDASGNCVGTCTGTCMGTCSASCTGMCSGTCVSDVTASCTGECAGTCSVDFVAPRCEGTANVQADPQCQAACRADVSATAECTEPSITITTIPEIDIAAQARLLVLIRTLYRNYPAFLSASAHLASTVEAGVALGQTLQDAASVTATLGAQAGICVATQATEVAAALVKINASISVSVTVNASVTATAN